MEPPACTPGSLPSNRQRGSHGETSRAKTDNLAHQLYDDEADFQVVDQVVNLAKQHGATPAQIALAWLLHQASVTAPIIGASKMKHLEEAVAAVDLVLNEDECALLEQPYRPHPIKKHS